MENHGITVAQSSVPVYVPFMTIGRFASSVGVSDDTVLGWQRKGYISTIKLGKRVMVDLRPWLSEVRS
jgi:hypothetical protein